jgi:hypothetical protein
LCGHYEKVAILIKPLQRPTEGAAITYDLYAGETDWHKKVELTELAKYLREAA